MASQQGVALIVGVTSSLGREVARKILQKYENVIVTGRDKEKLDAEVRSLKSVSKNAVIEDYQLDLLCQETIFDWLKNLEEKIEHIDLLINIPAVFTVASFLETSIKQCEQDFQINFFAPYIINQYIGERMVKNGRGTIVNVGSSSGYGAGKNTAAYVASKHALLGLTRCMNEEWKERGVRTIYFAPGSMKTPMGEHVRNQDYETFIEPEAAANILNMMIEIKGNSIVEELSLKRMVYK
jgi:3-oxoacyl-[acyl-carrier protein] reductase